jgi:Icc-related predicted phosphoesterase
MKALFATDLHGNRFAYEHLFTRAEQDGIGVILLGGDLTPKWPVLSTLGDAVVPMVPHRLQVDSGGKTYVGYLESIAAEAHAPRKMETRYVNLGGYLEVVRNSLTFEQLLGEQRALQRLLNGRQADHSVSLSSEDWAHLVRAIARKFPEPSDVSDVLRKARFALLSVKDRAEYILAQREMHKAVETVRMAASESIRDLLPTLAEQTNESSHLAVRDLTGYATQTAGDHLQSWMERARSFDIARSHQVKFLRNYLSQRIRKYKSRVSGAQVYLILGNDDHEDCRAALAAMHAQGVCHDLATTPAKVGSVLLVGYPWVPSSRGQFYDAWERSEAQIFNDLRDLEAATSGRRTVYVVHAPPYGTPHDIMSDGEHVGSEAVLGWLQDGPKHLVLSGHIHEAPFRNGGIWQSHVEGTLCMQPGAWHDEALCAIELDLDDPSHAQWIRPAGHSLTD